MVRVFKFGGASVKNAAGIRNAVQIIKTIGGQAHLAVVVSAIGKTTNALEVLWSKACHFEPWQVEFDALKNQHMEVALDLFGSESKEVPSALERYFTRLEFQLLHARRYEPDMAYDQIVSFGEYLSSYLLAAYAKKKGLNVKLLNARFLIRTDMEWREGRVNMEETGRQILAEVEPALKTGIVITQGFIGGTKSGFVTTLGREGSDYTAALLGHFLNAASVTIWKDVPGVLNADPRWLSGAVLLPRLSYHDAAELTYYGATVIHPKTIRPLAQRNIPLHVRSFLEPEKEGTIVSEDSAEWAHPAFIVKQDLVLLSFTSKELGFIEERMVSEVLHAFHQENRKVHMLQVSALSLSIVTESKKVAIERLIAHLKSAYTIFYNENLTLVTIKNYSPEAIDFVKGRNEFILEQRSRHTCQLLLRMNH